MENEKKKKNKVKTSQRVESAEQFLIYIFIVYLFGIFPQEERQEFRKRLEVYHL